MSRPEPPTTLDEWRKAREKGWRPAPVVNLPRECHRAPDEWREGHLADLVADQLDRELPPELRDTLDRIKFRARPVTKSKEQDGVARGWNLAHVPDSRYDSMLDSYRRYTKAEGGDWDVLQAARLSSWFCALLSERNIKPWHLVTVADGAQKVWLSDGDKKKTGIGWVREIRDPRWVTYAAAGEHHYPRQYFTVALVPLGCVGDAETTIRLDEVIRNQSVTAWPDPMRGPEPLPVASGVEVTYKPPRPTPIPPTGAAPLACAMGNDPDHKKTYHEIHRSPLSRVFSAPWGVEDRGGVKPPEYGWASFGQPLCMGHFKAFFAAIERTWRPVVAAPANDSLTIRQAKAAKELSEALKGREDLNRDPADVREFDPLAVSGPREPLPTSEDPPEFDRVQLEEAAAELGIWEYLDDAERMIVSWRIDGLTWNDIAQAMGKSRKTIYNRRQAIRLLKKISEKSSG